MTTKKTEAVEKSETTAVAEDQAEYIETQKKIAKQQDQNPAQRPVMATPIDIPSTEPYPTGSPPDPEAAFEAAHGFRRTPPKEG